MFVHDVKYFHESGIDKLKLYKILPSVKAEIDREKKSIEDIESTRKTQHVVLVILDLLVVCGAIYLIGTGVFSNGPINWTLLGPGIGLAAIAVFVTAVALWRIHLKAKNEIEQINNARQPMEYTECINRLREIDLSVDELEQFVHKLTDEEFIGFREAVAELIPEGGDDARYRNKVLRIMSQSYRLNEMSERSITKLSCAFLLEMVKHRFILAQPVLPAGITASKCFEIMEEDTCEQIYREIIIREMQDGILRELINNYPLTQQILKAIAETKPNCLTQNLVNEIEDVYFLVKIIQDHGYSNQPFINKISAETAIRIMKVVSDELKKEVIGLMTNTELMRLVREPFQHQLIKQMAYAIAKKKPRFLTQKFVDRIRDAKFIQYHLIDAYDDNDDHPLFNKISAKTAILIMKKFEGEYEVRRVINLMPYDEFRRLMQKFNDSIEKDLTEQMFQLVLRAIAEKRSGFLTQDLVDKIQNIGFLQDQLGSPTSVNYQNKISSEAAIRIMGEGASDNVKDGVIRSMSVDALEELVRKLNEPLEKRHKDLTEPKIQVMLQAIEKEAPGVLRSVG